MRGWCGPPNRPTRSASMPHVSSSAARAQAAGWRPRRHSFRGTEAGPRLRSNCSSTRCSTTGTSPPRATKTCPPESGTEAATYLLGEHSSGRASGLTKSLHTRPPLGQPICRICPLLTSTSERPIYSGMRSSTTRSALCRLVCRPRFMCTRVRIMDGSSPLHAHQSRSPPVRSALTLSGGPCMGLLAPIAVNRFRVKIRTKPPRFVAPQPRTVVRRTVCSLWRMVPVQGHTCIGAIVWPSVAIRCCFRPDPGRMPA